SWRRRDRVARFVKTEIAAAWQADRGQETPSFIADCAAFDSLLAETCDFGLHIVAHEIDLLLAAALSRMASNLGRRGCKDQPAAAGVNAGKAEHVAKEGAIRLGIARVNDNVNPCDHVSLHDGFGSTRC